MAEKQSEEARERKEETKKQRWGKNNLELYNLRAVILGDELDLEIPALAREVRLAFDTGRWGRRCQWPACR